MIEALSGWSQHIPPTKECFKYGKECTMKMPPLIHIHNEETGHEDDDDHADVVNRVEHENEYNDEDID